MSMSINFMGEESEHSRRGTPVCDMRTPVLVESLEVVIPDPLVQSGRRQNQIVGYPHGDAKQRPKDSSLAIQRSLDQTKDRTPTNAVTPMHDVVGQGRVLWRKRSLQEAFSQPLSDPARRRGLVPVVDAAELPLQRWRLAAAAPVTHVPDGVHNDCADDAGSHPPNQRSDRRQAS